MALERVRFVHTSDWHLEKPLGGLCAVPAHLRDLFVDAPYWAAANVVDLAIHENVDFMVLAGDIVSTESASPFTLDFLLTQFQRLQQRQVMVYWIGGVDDDPDLWPSQLALPDNVVTFPVGRAEESVFRRGEDEVAVIVGRSAGKATSRRLSEFAGSSDRIPRIAIAYGDVSRKSLDGKGVDYWALGGRDESHQVAEGATTAWYCGGPQARNPQATGARGCHLVELGPAQTDVRELQAAAVRWHHESVEASTECGLDPLRDILRQRLDRLTAATAQTTRLITWTISGTEKLIRGLTDEVTNGLTEMLQLPATEGGTYTVGLEVQPPTVSAERWEDESILGDFLRAVRELEQDPEAWKQLEDYLPDESSVREPVLAALRDVSSDDRHRLWHDVACLGAGLLRPDASSEPMDLESRVV